MGVPWAGVCVYVFRCAKLNDVPDLLRWVPVIVECRDQHLGLEQAGNSAACHALGVAVLTQANPQYRSLVRLSRFNPELCAAPQVPDVDFVVHFIDTPVAELKTMPDSPPLFCYANNDGFAEVPFPDWTYWGNAGSSQQPSWQV